jgi:hypothetical protein
MSGGVCEPRHENGRTEHRAALCQFFCVKLGNSATKTHEKLQQVFGDDAMSRTQAFRWYNTFSEGRTLVEDQQRSGLPSTARIGDNTARLGELFRSDRRLTIRMIADEANMNRETVRLILTEELGMRTICAKMVPRNPIKQQRDAWLSAVFDIQMHYGDAAVSLLIRSLVFRLLFISKC